jgi:hypothetical protein
MGLGTEPGKLMPRVPLRHGEGSKDHLTSFEGLANAVTPRLIPLYAIGVFTGFTISQTGLVRHWHSQRTPRWLLHAALNGTGAILTATATAVFAPARRAVPPRRQPR